MENRRLLWYVVRTNVQQEDRVVSNLNAWQVESFAPKIKERRPSSRSIKPVYAIKPLFPDYVFARFDALEKLHKIRFTRGVCEVVTFGGEPKSVDGEIISALKSRINGEGLVKLDDDFQKGDRVSIKGGPFRGFNGVFERKTSCFERVIILLNSVGSQTRVEIDRDLLTEVTQRRRAG